MTWWMPLAVLCFLTALSGYACWFGWNASVEDAIMRENFDGVRGAAVWPGAVMFLGGFGACIFGSGVCVWARAAQWDFSYNYLQERFENESIYEIAAETYRRRGHSVIRLYGSYPMFVAERAGSKTLVCIDAKSPHLIMNPDHSSDKAFANIKTMRKHMEAAGIKSGLLCVPDKAFYASIDECSKAANIKLIPIHHMGMMAYRTRKHGDVPAKEPQACGRCDFVH